MLVYDDPWYYPYRRYGGTRTVFARPFRPQPRYIFKDWGSARPTRETFLSPGTERPANDNGRRGGNRRDIGGAGGRSPPARAPPRGWAPGEPHNNAPKGGPPQRRGAQTRG